jgi:Ca2+-binding RTX toxin-like protein
MSAVFNWNFPNDSGARPYLFGDDFMLGTRADDVIYGFSGNDTIRGYSGNDILRGMHGRDQLAGGSGDDVLVFDGSTSGFDTLSLRWASVGPEQASGGPGKDFFVFRPTEISLTPTNDLYQLFDLPSLSGNYDKDNKFIGNYRYKFLPDKDYNEQKSIWAVNKSGNVVQFTYNYNGESTVDKYLTAVHNQAFDAGTASTVFGAQTFAFRDNSANFVAKFLSAPVLTPISPPSYSGLSSTYPEKTGGIGVINDVVIPVYGVGTGTPPWIVVPGPTPTSTTHTFSALAAPNSTQSDQITVPVSVSGNTYLAATNIMADTMDGSIPTGAGVRIWVRSDQNIVKDALEVRFFSETASALTPSTAALDRYPLPALTKDLWTPVILQGNWFAGDANSLALFAFTDVSGTAPVNIWVDRLELIDSALGGDQFRVLRADELDDANLTLTYKPVINVGTVTRTLQNSNIVDLFDRPRGSDGFPYGREFYDGGGDSGPDGFVGPSGLQQWFYNTNEGVYSRVKDDNQYYNPFLSQNQNREPFSSQDPNRVSALTERIRITDFQVGSDKIDLSAYGITNEFLQSNNLYYGGPVVGNLFSSSLTSFPSVSLMKLTGTAYLAALSTALSTKEGLTITAGRTPWTGGALSLFIKENTTLDYNNNGQKNDTLVEIQLVGLSLGSVSARMFGEAAGVFGLE